MANFQAQGTVESVTQRGQGNVVALREKEGKPAIEIYCGGTPPIVGQEVVCIGFVNGREYNGKVYPNLSGTFATAIHSTKAEQRPAPPRPQQSQRMPEQSPFDDDSENPY